MKNKISDLNNHLFAELERLSDEELVGDELDQELKRASGIARIAGQIIETGDLAVRAKKVMLEYGVEKQDMPDMLVDKNG